MQCEYRAVLEMVVCNGLGGLGWFMVMWACAGQYWLIVGGIGSE